MGQAAGDRCSGAAVPSQCGWQDVHTFLASSRGHSLKATILSRKLITLSVHGMMGCVRTPDTALEALQKVEQQPQISVDRLSTYCPIQSSKRKKKKNFFFVWSKEQFCYMAYMAKGLLTFRTHHTHPCFFENPIPDLVLCLLL